MLLFIVNANEYNILLFHSSQQIIRQYQQGETLSPIYKVSGYPWLLSKSNLYFLWKSFSWKLVVNAIHIAYEMGSWIVEMK